MINDQYVYTQQKWYIVYICKIFQIGIIMVSRQPVHSKNPDSATSCDTIFQNAFTCFVLD